MDLTKRLKKTLSTLGVMMLIFVALAFSMLIIHAQNFGNDKFNQNDWRIILLAFISFVFFVIVCCFNRNGNFLLLALPKIFDTIHYVLPIGYIVSWAVFYSGLPIWAIYAVFGLSVAYCASVFVYCYAYARKLSQVPIMANVRNNHIRPNDIQRQKFESYCAKKLDLVSFAVIFALMIFNMQKGNDIVLIALIVCALVGILTVTLPMYKYIYPQRKIRITLLVVQLILFCIFSTLSILMYYGVVKLSRYPDVTFNEIKILGLIWLFAFGNALLYPRTALQHTEKFQALLNE